MLGLDERVFKFEDNVQASLLLCAPSHLSMLGQPPGHGEWAEWEYSGCGCKTCINRVTCGQGCNQDFWGRQLIAGQDSDPANRAAPCICVSEEQNSFDTNLSQVADSSRVSAWSSEMQHERTTSWKPLPCASMGANTRSARPGPQQNGFRVILNFWPGFLLGLEPHLAGWR